MIEIHRYTAAYHRDWNDFVSESSNGTFLFLREYMEYHADRFTDYSLLVYDGNKLLALLPANRSGDVLYSHAGLTYGGVDRDYSEYDGAGSRNHAVDCRFFEKRTVCQMGV